MQPHLVSCAAVLTDDACAEVQSFRLVVRPDGWASKPDALAVHGVTQEFALAVGVPLLTVLSAFFQLAKVADRHVAFNYDFDSLVLEAALARCGKPTPFDPRKALCEMKAMTQHCRLPHAPGKWRGGQEFKWPSLQQAHEHATGSGFAGAHDAMADVRALVAVHRWRMEKFGELEKLGA